MTPFKAIPPRRLQVALQRCLNFEQTSYPIVDKARVVLKKIVNFFQVYAEKNLLFFWLSCVSRIGL